MTDPSLSVVTWYFPIDCDHSLANEVLKLGIDDLDVGGGGGAAAVYVSSPSAWLLAHPAEPPLVRYWWSMLIGPGQTIHPDRGVTEIFGRLQDNPQFPLYKWRIRNPN